MRAADGGAKSAGKSVAFSRSWVKIDPDRLWEKIPGRGEMRVFSIKWLTAVAAVLIAPAFASAAIVVNIASDSRTTSGSTQNFTLDITFSNDGAAQPIVGYDTALQITSASTGLTITGVGTSTNGNLIANPVLPGNPAFAINSGFYLISRAELDPGSIDNGDGLYRILLQAAPNTTGTFTISFFNNESSGFDTKLFSDFDSNEVPNTTFGTGTVTFSPVPEPATLGLALLGLPLILRRRR
jgi:hypothetical protein